MKKCIVTGIVTANKYDSSNSFAVLNGDIETNENGEEIYIMSRRKENSSESEDILKLVAEHYVKEKRIGEIENMNYEDILKGQF